MSEVNTNDIRINESFKFYNNDAEAVASDSDLAKVYDKVREAAVKEYCSTASDWAKQDGLTFKYKSENLRIVAIDNDHTDSSNGMMQIWFEEMNTDYILGHSVLVRVNKVTQEIQGVYFMG